MCGPSERIKPDLNNKIEEFMFKYNYNDLNTQAGRLKTNVRNMQLTIDIIMTLSMILMRIIIQ